MKKILLVFLSIFLFALNVTAQGPIQVPENTLEDQMTDVFDKSNSYEEFKVIKKIKLARLRRSILDSVSALEQNISNQEIELRQQKAEIDSLRQKLKNTQQNLNISKEKEDGMAVFGIYTSKAVYNSIMWGIILTLLVVSALLLYRFLNSHKITKDAQLKVSDKEIELEEFRRNSLEREQKLRRKLLDEINKNRKA
jgi:uncharacterized membrane protein